MTGTLWNISPLVVIATITALSIAVYIYSNKPVKKATLYERLGGYSAIKAVVDAFYVKILADPSLAPFFSKSNMPKQAEKQAKFLSAAFGGPEPYGGKDLRTSHKHMKISDADFNAVAGHLASTLKDFNVSEEIISEVISIAATTRADIVNS